MNNPAVWVLACLPDAKTIAEFRAAVVPSVGHVLAIREGGSVKRFRVASVHWEVTVIENGRASLEGVTAVVLPEKER